MERKILLYGGILSPIVFLLNDIIGGVVTPNYSYVVNTISDLTKAGAHDSYLLGSILLFLSALLSIAFGIGIITRYRFNYSKLLFLGGLILIIMGLSNSLTGTVFPQDHIGGEVTFPGTMHLLLVGINVALIFPALIMIGIGFYREKQWKSFMIYSFISLSVMFVFGGLSAYVIMNGIELMGLTERFVVYAFQLWSFILAYILIKEEKSS